MNLYISIRQNFDGLLYCVQRIDNSGRGGRRCPVCVSTQLFKDRVQRLQLFTVSRSVVAVQY